MSGAKQRMREKKLSKQPASVQYSSSPLAHSQSGGSRNGRDTPMSGHSSGYAASPGGPSDGGVGWVRGHQKDGGGYEVEMPKFITASTFAQARAAEVQAMMKAVTKATGSCHVSGAIPKHMRRRAMSHNSKRLPCRLRELADRMKEKGLQAGAKKKKEQPKSKSRKARRRHGNLLLEFNRRQRKNVWLETHIWHAKRFHMLKKWGYCLGDRPTSKCYRACYRAMSSHCLLQDLSYYCCIELQGEEEALLACLSQLTSKETGPTFAAVLALSGRKQGAATIYRTGQYPAQPLGPVTFLWRPRTPGSSHRQLWIWAHPTLKQDLLPELQSACQCSEPVIPAVAPVATPAEPAPAALPPAPRRAKKTLGAKRKRSAAGGPDDGPPEKKILGDGTRPPSAPVSWTSASTGVLINDLTMEIVRYRLTGPKSHAVLTEALEAATYCDAASKAQASPLWWPQHCKDQAQMTLHWQQAEVFRTLKGICSSGEVPPGTVLGLNVEDPRLALPQTRTKEVSVATLDPDVDEKTRELMLKGVPEHCCQSSLWDRFVRDNVSDNKLSEQEMNRRKREVLVPGSRLRPTPLQGRVPLLMVQQPGKQAGQEMSGWGAGWDLLLPKGWGMAFWVPLVYRGVRIGGLHMSLKHVQNQGAPHFPHDYPDCPAGARFQEEQETELLHKFKRRPPAKRTNYIKHGCLAPFRCPWQQLVEEWELIAGAAEGEERRGQGAGAPAVRPGQTGAAPGGFSVLRNRKSLRLLSGWCRPSTTRGQRSLRARDQAPLDDASSAALLSAHVRALAWVRLSLLAKGRPELHAQVCVPTPEDLQRLGGKDVASSAPLEPPHKDRFKSKVKRRKKGSKKTTPAPGASGTDPDPPLAPDAVPLDPTSTSSGAALSQTPASTLTEDPPASSSARSPPSDLVLGLWPHPLPSVTSHCSRVTLGWVTQGDFSLSAGCGEALGLVSLEGLVHSLLAQPAQQRGLVLLRNPSALHYRWAKVNVEA